MAHQTSLNMEEGWISEIEEGGGVERRKRGVGNDLMAVTPLVNQKEPLFIGI